MPAASSADRVLAETPSAAIRRQAAEDRDQHKKLASSFWIACTLLTGTLVLAYPPTVPIGATAGWTVVAVMTVVAVAYIVRLRRIVPSQTEIFVGAVLGTAVVGVDQWLCGGFESPLALLLTLHVLGSSGVLTPRQRSLYLGVIAATAAAPCLYDSPTTPQLLTVAVLVLLLALESALLAMYADRLRLQQHQLEESERVATASALTDELTGLANRRALMAALATADRSAACTLVYLDLDGFKAFNDAYGHGAGDELLHRLSRRLVGALAGRGTAYRLGGDEFCVLAPGTVGHADPLVAAIAASLREDRGGVAITTSIGVASMPEDAADASGLLQVADRRMYVDKACKAPGGVQRLTPAGPTPDARAVELG